MTDIHPTFLINGRWIKQYQPCAMAQAHGVPGPSDSFDMMRIALAMRERCVFRREDVCDTTCEARVFCRPEDWEAQDV